jgi:hypothetical protein
LESLRHILKHRLIQAQIRLQLVQPAIFVLQLPHLPDLFRLQAHVLLLPAVERLLADANLPDQLGHWRKVRRKRLAEFRLHFASILLDTPFSQLYMLQLHGSNSPRARQERKRHQREVPPLNLAPARHRLNHALHLLQRRRFPLSLSRGSSRVFLRKVEVVGIGILKACLIPRLPRKPEKELAHLGERGM